MDDKQLVWFASEFREGILDGGSPRMMCWAVSAPLEALLRMYGVETELAESDLGECNHFFLRLPDGRVLDPTADQFNYVRSEAMPPVYLGPPVDLHGVAALPPAGGR
ncbi:hypothetical protein ASG52_19930 [Methylobacterium sp. Leaf456]|uniref:hypothetical protein n=1 Tax=Methylobacterium sp. Leaf456 TaxID=1736382 RepID=UPI000700E6F2|nr:hypothetical protein [Methylobacterium sp. Leaf456]KQT59997.1 hypothetical protein ASG52_19930 [Methylobacterium sp. Leaf456]